MPYIDRDRRRDFDSDGLDALCAQIEARMHSDADYFGPGDLAYIVYRLLNAAAPRGSRFERRNTMMAAVDEARMEYRRRIHEPAEDEAIRQNGDI
jgi:hypothetical protein